MSISEKKAFELYKKLITIYDDKDFVDGSLQLCRNDDGIDVLLKFINENEGVEASDVTLFLLENNTELGKYLK